MTEEYMSAIISPDDLSDSTSLQLLESICGLQPQNIHEDVFNGIDLHLECEDDDLSQPVYSEESQLLPHTVIGQNVCLRVTFPLPSEGPDDTSTATFQCSHCESTFCRQYKLARHLLDVHSITKNFQCAECPFATTSTRLLRRHRQKRHVQIKKGQKSEVASFTSKGSSMNSENQVINSDVEGYYSSTAGIPRVDKCQSDQFLYVCAKCPYKCCHHRSLDLHTSHKHDPNRKDFICTQCSFTCKQKRTLVIHGKTHSNEPPLQCDMCKKTFLVESALKRHARTHTDERSFICTYEHCNKAFRLKELLAGHICRVHEKKKKDPTGSKVERSQFVCPREGCSKTFRDNHNLKAHLCRHTGDKPMKCQHCNFRYVQKASLNLHVKKVHS